ncbi:MAG: phospholipid carrier-dependent glycosyltransferase, partial [Burkholderiales bacterium]
FLVVWFGALDEREFFNPDEGRYAEIPREMVASGDWITPRLNGFKYFEKPVLQYWITAVSYLALGEEEFVARLWPALSGFLTLLLVYYMGRRLAGVRAGVVAAAVLSTTFQFFVFSQLLTLDMGLSFFLTLALYGFLVSQDLRAAPRQQRNGAILMWVAMALAVLSKGLIGVVLPALVLLVYIAVERDWKLLGRLRSGIGVPVFLAIALPWFIWVQLRNPEFFQFFFIREHFGRYALHEHHRAGAWYYFPAVLLIGSLPWSFMYIRAAFTSWRKQSPNHFAINPTRLLALWAITISVFYSVSESKLPGYILPVYPALALLLGCYAQREKKRLSRRMLLVMVALGVAMMAAAPFVTRIPKFAGSADLIEPFVAWAMAGGGILIAASVLAMAAMARYPRFALSALGFGLLFSFQVLVTGSESIEDQFSAEALVDHALDKIGDFDADIPFYSLDMYDQSMPHHLQRTFTIVRFRGELEMGIAQDPAKAVASVEEFRRLWQGHRQAYAIMPRAQFEAERSVGTPVSILAINRNCVIVTRAALTEIEKRPRRADY